MNPSLQELGLSTCSSSSPIPVLEHLLPFYSMLMLRYEIALPLPPTMCMLTLDPQHRSGGTQTFVLETGNRTGQCVQPQVIMSLINLNLSGICPKC